MQWTVIRRDFTHAVSVDCVFCHHKLTNGVAFVVLNENGDHGFSDSKCVMRTENYEADFTSIPDFTSAIFTVSDNDSNADGYDNKGENAIDNRRLAITYLLLRFERLNHHGALRRRNKGMLAQIYARYRMELQIPDTDINYLLSCANNKTNNLRFNLRNLMAFYNLANLCKVVGLSENSELLPQDKPDAERIERDLYANMHGLPADIQLINQMLQRIESKYKMKENAFQ